MAVQGQSWGGYQVSYLITQTNLFKAAEAGAPVSNMTSAYGGIRWKSGMSRMFQFFNHYLKNEPAPVWMKSGIPAIKKGKTLGYEIEK